MRMFVSLAAAAVLASGLSVGAQPAQAVTLSFFNISNNSGDADDLINQLSVEVTEGADDTQASFTFLNNVGIASSITDVYFDDGSLLGIATIIGSAGVSFAEGASPPDLSGGNPFSFDSTFSADSTPPTAPNGVDSSSEFLTIVFNLIDGLTFTDTIAALLSGDLRIGLHVQAIGLSGDSDAFINNPPPPIPLPAGLVLFLSGLAGVGFLGRYKSKRQELNAA
jgi:hypothetical protein